MPHHLQLVYDVTPKRHPHPSLLPRALVGGSGCLSAEFIKGCVINSWLGQGSWGPGHPLEQTGAGLC